jgi:hypothetical protein
LRTVTQGKLDTALLPRDELRRLFALRTNSESDTHDSLNCKRCPRKAPPPPPPSDADDDEAAAKPAGARAIPCLTPAFALSILPFPFCFLFPFLSFSLSAPFRMHHVRLHMRARAAAALRGVDPVPTCR